MAEISTREALASVKEKLTDLNKRMNAYEKERTNLLKDKKDLEGSLSKLSSSYKAEVKAQHELESKISSVNQEIQSLSKRMEGYKQEKQGLTSSKSTWQHKVSQADSEYSSASGSASHWQTQRVTSEGSKDALESERSNLGDYENMEMCGHSPAWPCLKRNKKRVKRNEKRKDLDNKIKELSQKVTEYFSKETAYRQEKEKASKEKEYAQSKLRQLESRENDLAKSINSLEKEHKALNKKLQDYSKDLSAHKEKAAQKLNEKSAVEKKLSELTSKEKSLLQDSKEAKLELKELEEQKIGLEKVLDTIQIAKEIAKPKIDLDLGEFVPKQEEVATDEVNSELQFSQEGYEEVTM